MKLVNTLVLLCIVATSFAQKSITKNIGDFTEIKVYDRIVVNLIKSNNDKVVISGEDATQVQIINKDGKLKVRMELGLIFDGNKTVVDVYYNNLEIIDGNEGAEITGKLIEQDEIAIKMQEGARINAHLKVREAHFKAITGGIIEAKGIAQQQEVIINTGGSFNGRDFKTERATISVQAGGEAEVFASKKVDVTVRAGGNVTVYGKPEDVKRKRTLGGRITIL